MRALILAMLLFTTTPTTLALAGSQDCWMPICEPVFRAPAGMTKRVNPDWLKDRRIGCACLGEPSRSELRANNAMVRKLLSQGVPRVRRSL